MMDKLLRNISCIALMVCTLTIINMNFALTTLLLICVCVCQQLRLDSAREKVKTIESQLRCYQSFICKQLRKYKFKEVHNGSNISR